LKGFIYTLEQFCFRLAYLNIFKVVPAFLEQEYIANITNFINEAIENSLSDSLKMGFELCECSRAVLTSLRHQLTALVSCFYAFCLTQNRCPLLARKCSNFFEFLKGKRIFIANNLQLH